MPSRGLEEDVDQSFGGSYAELTYGLGRARLIYAEQSQDHAEHTIEGQSGPSRSSRVQSSSIQRPVCLVYLVSDPIVAQF